MGNNDATQDQGADLASAASAISNLMDGGKKRPPNEAASQANAQQQTQEHEVESETDHQEHDDAQQVQEVPQEEQAEYEIPSHLDALAEAIGVDASKLLNVKVKTKIDGQEGEASLADLVKSYQLEGHLNKKSMALSEQQKALEADFAQRNAQFNQYLNELNTYTQFIENQLYQEFSSVNWEELKTYNPAEYAVKRQEFNDRYQQVQQFNAAVNQKYQQEQAKTREEWQQRISHAIKVEGERLLTKLPEWKDQEKASAEQKEIRSYLKSHGFDEEELNSVYDHRHVILARKAMQFDKLAQSKPQINKKVKVLPNVLKPGALRSKAEVNAEQRKLRINTLKRSGSVKDAASIIEGLL